MTKGLTLQEAEERLERYGPNEFREEEGTSIWDILKRQVKNILILILVAAAIISFFTGEMVEFYFILFIIGLIVVMSSAQEWKAEEAMKQLKEMAQPTATVIREGEVFEIPNSEIVPGDILKLHTGDRIPADAEVSESKNLEIDESPMTGESESVRKSEKDPLYSGTTVVHGRGEAKVTKTGEETELGKIASELGEKERETPLQKKIDVLGKKLGIIAVLATVFILLLGLLTGSPFAQVLLVALAITVASIPEGLPLALTLTLSMGVRDLAKKNAIVRKMLAVEGLGSTTVICTDKTGTLTKNEMTVEKVFTFNKEYKVTGVGYKPEGKILDRDGEEVKPEEHPDLVRLLRGGMLCNDAELIYRDDETCDVRGSPTEGALITLGEKLTSKHEENIKDVYPRIDEIPFSSDRKRMSTIHETPDGGKLVFMKGAPEFVLDYCSTVLLTEKERELTEEDREMIIEQTEEYTKNAMRVLALAYKEEVEEPYDEENVEKDLNFLGLVAMEDPPRDGVKETIERCKNGGLEIKMVTGDNSMTAKSIAEKIGLTETGEVLTGKDIRDMSEEELVEAVGRTDIYARTMPDDKYKLVKAFQKRGEVVAMTGDGMNDAPAVKRADVGVGMGKKGTDVTKEASDVVLQDDNFNTLVSAIENGRRIYDNIEKFVTYLISRNFTEISVIVLAIIAFLDFEFLPLAALQVLFLNVIGQEMPAVALGLDPASKHIMDRPPKNTKLNILHKRNLLFIAPMAIYMAFVAFYVYLYVGPGTNLARTAVFTSIVLMIMVNTFNFKSLEKNVTEVNWIENKLLWLSLSAITPILLATIYNPTLAGIFGHEPLAVNHWIIAIGVALSTVVIIEILKKISNSWVDTSYMWKN